MSPCFAESMSVSFYPPAICFQVQMFRKKLARQGMFDSCARPVIVVEAPPFLGLFLLPLAAHGCECHDISSQAAQEERSSEPTPRPVPASAVPEQEQRRHLLISGRFNSPKNLQYMEEVKRLLDSKDVPVYMVKTRGPGDEFGTLTMLGLYRARGLIAFCTADYGARTGIQYETFKELEYAHQNHLHIIPVQLCENFPPMPEDELARAQNRFVLRPVIHRIEDKTMQEAERVANEIADAWDWIQNEPTKE